MNRKFLEELGLEKETIDSIMAEHGKAIQSVKPADDYEDLKNANATYEQQLEDLQKELATKDDELSNVDDLKNQIEEYKLKDLKTSIAIKANIPLELAGRLSGETEEEIKADAETIAEYVNKKSTLPLKSIEPSVNDKDAKLKNMLKNMNRKQQGE